MEDETLLTFPCDLPIKVFGRNQDVFRSAAVAIVRRHFGIAETRVAEQLSREERYSSLTITVHAESREQVDALYRDLTASEDVLMVL